jgi:MFS family permease
MSQQARKFLGRRVLGALCVIIFFTAGFAYYGAAVINAQAARDLQLSRTQLGLGVTLMQLTLGFLSPGVGWTVNRIGSRLSMFYGSCAMALGALILGCYISNGWHYMLVYGVVVGGGMAFSSFIPSQACAALWFEKRRATALAVLWAANGLGGFVVSPLLVKIIAAADGNWRAGWYFVGAVAILTSLVALRFVKNRPSDYGQKPDGVLDGATADVRRLKSVYQSSEGWTLNEALRTRALWLIIFAAIGYSASFVALLAHLVPHLKGLGYEPATAAGSIGVVAGTSVIGKLGSGFLCDRIEPRYVWMGGLLLVAASMIVAVLPHSVWEVYLLGALLGVGSGFSAVCWSAMVANYYGGKSYASVMGMMMSFGFIATAPAPFIVGYVYDVTGTYVDALFGLTALCLLAGVSLIAAIPPRHGQPAGSDPPVTPVAPVGAE